VAGGLPNEDSNSELDELLLRIAYDFNAFISRHQLRYVVSLRCTRYAILQPFAGVV